MRSSSFRAAALAAVWILLAACGASSSNHDSVDAGTEGGSGGASSGTGASSGGEPADVVATKARALAIRLRGRPDFLIGMGNDLGATRAQDGVHRLGATLDLHYVYLTGLRGEGGWPDWNENGGFVDIIADSSAERGVTPMFSLYQMAAWGDGNEQGWTDVDYMSAYWQGVSLLFERLARFDQPAVLHLEPDFWGYAQRAARREGHMPAMLVGQVESRCADLGDTLPALMGCVLRLGRAMAPKVAIGVHASTFGAESEDAVDEVSAFLREVGADAGDFLATDMLDRDAGCFEAAVDPNCQRSAPHGFYLDESNRHTPNFHERNAWISSVARGVQLPVLLWQVPFGVPSDTPGGTPGHYRDNRAKYIMSHVDEMIATGVFGSAFGVGAPNQTTPDSDGGQFAASVQRYYAAPHELP